MSGREGVDHHIDPLTMIQVRDTPLFNSKL